jgi:O-antigen ligase
MIRQMEQQTKPVSLRERLRFPYASDKLFSLIFFTTLFLPLAFFNNFTEGFEAPKLALWLACTGVAAIIITWQKQATLRYLLWSIVATIFSFDHINSLVGLPGRFTSSLLFHSLWVGWLLILLASLNAEKRTFLLKTVLACSVAIAVLGILQQKGFAFYPGLNPQLRVLAPSFLGNPNFSSMFVAGLVPLALYFVTQSKTLAAKIYYLAAAFLIIWSVILFASRGSIIGLWVSLGLFLLLGLWLFRAQRRLLLYSVGGLIVSVILFAGFYTVYRPNTAVQTVALSETTVDSRLMVWTDSLKLIADRPWVGTGLGNFFIAFKKIGNPVFNTGERFDDAHNIFLHQAAVGGIPLLAFFALIIIIPAWLGLKSLRHDRDPLVAGLLAALAGLLVAMSFNPTTIACWLLLATILASLIMSSTKDKQINWPFVMKPWGIIKGLILISLAVLLFASEYFAFRGLSAYRKNDFARAEQQSRLASKFNPTSSQALAYWAAGSIKQNRPAGQSLQLIERLKNLHPNSSGTYQTVSVLYYLLNAQTNSTAYNEQMWQSLEKEVALEPNYGPIYGQVAYAYYKSGNKDKALEYLRKSLATNNKQFYQWVLLAKIYHETNQRNQAIYAFEQAYLLQPDSLLLKKTLQAMKDEPDVTKINIPVYFPDLNL